MQYSSIYLVLIFLLLLLLFLLLFLLVLRFLLVILLFRVLLFIKLLPNLPARKKQASDRLARRLKKERFQR
jgi:fatty acid desaturase